MDVFSQRIASLRKERGWRRAEVAARAGVSRGYIWDLEEGRREPRAENVLRFAEAFGVHADYLLGLTDDPYGQAQNGGLPPEMQAIWDSLKTRPELRLLVSTAHPLSKEQIESICTFITKIRTSGG